MWCRSDEGFLCGNGVRDVGEACDDGNRASDDGCDEMCVFEAGWSCTATVDAATGTSTDVCIDVDECADPAVCAGTPDSMCINIASEYICACEHGFVEEAGRCKPCEDSHWQAGVCAEGPSCNAIKLSDPSKQDGVYYVQPQGAVTPLAVTCDMTTDNGGWTLVYKIAGPSTMMTADAVNPELLASPDAVQEAEHSAKLSDTMIRDLCSEQYRVQQWLSTVGGNPQAIYCSFDDLNEYGDGVQNIHKSCRETYDSQGDYPSLSFDQTWSYGFSTWGGGLAGATILQLDYGDGRHGSHICHDCTAGDLSAVGGTCGGGGQCHSEVWCRSDEAVVMSPVTVRCLFLICLRLREVSHLLTFCGCSRV